MQPSGWSVSRWIWTALGVLVALIGIALISFFVWATWIAAPMPEATAALAPTAAVSVQPGNPIVFAPTGQPPTCGLIFYPGGRVDPRAYAPAMASIAEAGYLVLVPAMPLNLAVFAPNRAADLMADHPEITRWVVGGHSLGGAMAASFVHDHPDETAGLLLWASYPASSTSLADRSELEVASIYGTLDGVADLGKITGAAQRLPASTNFVPIEGGNHGQFGWYGNQRGDNPATISRAEQQAQAVDATLELMQAACGEGQ